MITLSLFSNEQISNEHSTLTPYRMLLVIRDVVADSKKKIARNHQPSHPTPPPPTKKKKSSLACIGKIAVIILLLCILKCVLQDKALPSRPSDKESPLGLPVHEWPHLSPPQYGPSLSQKAVIYK